MEHTRKLHTWGGFLLLLVLLVTFLIWNLLAGSVRLPASEIWAILHGGGDLTQRRILLNIRLPRLLAAMILGGALSVSASPSHLPWEGRPWGTHSNGFPYEGKLSPKGD